MLDFGKTESTVRPQAVVLDTDFVWVASNIAEVTRPAVSEEDVDFVGFEYDLVMFTKDEYILHKMDHDKVQSELALAELATLVISMGGAI